jgi:hypothetical protein
MRRLRLILSLLSAFAAAAVAHADPAEQARKLQLRESQPPADLVKGSAKREAKGEFFQASYEPEGGAIVLSKMTSWTFTLKTVKGEPVANAAVRLTGFMPQHSHGFPTIPAIKETAPGTYVASGLKFHMPGWWVVHLFVEAGGKNEFLEFQLIL